MEWAAVIRDIVIGLLIAGAVAAWVPDSFWRHFFAVGHPLLSKVWGPLIGPIVSLMSFVCSIGNVPAGRRAGNAGISFGGVISFIFADLIILPILVIYRKYYGTRMMLFILGSFYVTMVAAGYIVEILFTVLGPGPHRTDAKVGEMSIQWDYTTVLNIVALVVGRAPELPVRTDRRDAHAQDDGRRASVPMPTVTDTADRGRVVDRYPATPPGPRLPPGQRQPGENVRSFRCTRRPTRVPSHVADQWIGYRPRPGSGRPPPGCCVPGSPRRPYRRSAVRPPLQAAHRRRASVPHPADRTGTVAGTFDRPLVAALVPGSP